MAARRSLALAVLLLAAGLGLAGVADGDHVYSHRYYVLGRVVNATGAPVEGVEVTADFQGLAGPEPDDCPEERPPVSQPVSDDEGRYLLCRHAHTLPPNATVTVRAPGDVVTRVLDRDYRRSIVHLEVPDEAGSAGRAPATASELDVHGIVWRPGEFGRQEGVPVNGRAVTGVNVTVTLGGLPDGASLEAGDRTDDYGTFEVEFPDAGGDLDGAWVQVSAVDPRTGEAVERRLPLDGDAREHRFAYAPAELEPRPRELGFLWWSLGGLAAAAAALYGLHLLVRRDALPDPRDSEPG